MKRQPRIDDIGDAELIAFVLWCRLNDERIVSMPDLVRTVLKAYAGARTGKKVAA